MIINFTGSEETRLFLEKTLSDSAVIEKRDKGDVHICEIKSLHDLVKIGLYPQIPVFLIINTSSKNIIDSLKNYKFNGIFMPPLNPEIIKSKILSAKQNVVSNEAVDVIKIKLLAKAESMPTLPVFAQKLIGLTSKDAGNIKEIVELIKQDQILSSRIIKMINSPFYGMRQEITSIDRAVVFLGFGTIKNVALVVASNGYYSKNFDLYGMTGTQLWKHAYHVALLSEYFAKRCGFDSDSAFLAGLLHDIGKTLMVEFLINKVDSVDDEVKQLNIDHAEAAGAVLKRWQVAQSISDAVREHHNERNKGKNLPSVVYHANLAAHLDTINETVFHETLEMIADGLRIDKDEEMCKKIATLNRDAR